jgi:hypothetical protein
MSMSLRSSMVLAAGLVAVSVGSARAQSPAASACPTQYFLSGELALNPSLETVGPNGPTTCWSAGDPSPAPSAAAGWFMHSSNSQATVCSRMIPTTLPWGGSRMVHFRAGGNEGGLYQYVNLPTDKTYMFSVWVYVRRGQVAIQSNALSGGPVSWSTKIGQWEQLRVCTNSLFSTNMLVVYNQDPDGGDFFVDLAELREIPTLE